MLLSGATVYTVNSASGLATGTGNSGTLPYVIGQANIDPNSAGSEIEFDPTVFAGSSPQTIAVVGTLELSEADGPEVIDGPGATVLTVASDPDADVRVFQVDEGVTATLNGLTIARGVARPGDDDSDDRNPGEGGGISNDGGTLTVDDCTVTGNFAERSGGGIFNSGSLKLVGGMITDNRAGSSSGSGGGIYNSRGTIAVNGTTIDNNTADDGGGIFVRTGTLTISGSTLAANSASETEDDEDSSSGSGGGLYNVSGSVHITNCNLSNNVARSTGGGIYCGGGEMAISGDTISGNSADDDGGGIYAGGGTLTIEDSTISANSAGEDGGGIANGTTLTINNSTITTNSADLGGGLWSDGVLTAVNVTIVRNQTTDQSGSGAGLDAVLDDQDEISSTDSTNVTLTTGFTSGPIIEETDTTLDDSIVALNTSPGPDEGEMVADDIAGTVAGSYDLIGTGGSGGLSNTNGNQIGVGEVYLGRLANNGGNTATIALLPGSPAIGAGSDEISGVSVPAMDQRGVARPSDRIDVGAFQDQGFTFTVLADGSPQSTTVDTAFDDGLSVEVSSIAGDPVMGGVVTFLTPSSGASATLSAATATISCRGDVAIVTATANGTVGGYDVTATAPGVTSPAVFALTNDPLQVAPLVATTMLASSLSPSLVGQVVNFTATVDAVNASAIPAGTVTFTIDGQVEPPVNLVMGDGMAQAVFSTATLAAGTHTIGAAYNGDGTFASDVAPVPLTQTVDAPARQASATSVASSADPSIAGESVFVTATVAPTTGTGIPTGTVSFTIDGKIGSPIGLAEVNGRDQATITMAALAAGNYTITASYSGDGDFAPSSSNAATQVVDPAAIVPPPVTPGVDGPTVVSVQRYGYHMRPTVLVLTFNQALDVTNAQDAKEYRVISPAGRVIGARSAVYDPTTRAVTLHLRQRISIHRTYTMVVDGRMSNTNGQFLDGEDDGQSGSAYRGPLTWRNLVLDPPPPGSSRWPRRAGTLK